MLANATPFVCLLTIISIGFASAQSSGYIYWTEDTKVRRAYLDGTGVEDLVTDVNIGVGIALDLTNNHIYWVERGSNKIRRANLDGSSPQDIITGLRSGRGRGIALDLTNNHIYWGVDGGGNGYYRANLDGSSPEHILNSSSAWGPALDVPNNHIY